MSSVLGSRKKRPLEKPVQRIMMCKTKGMRKTLEREGDREGKQKTGRVGDRDITRQNQRQLETQRKR